MVNISSMAKSKYEYVKQFEQDDALLPGCWIVIRIDGKGFTKFSSAHGFEKPNDARALELMDRCAEEVLREFGDIVLAYGESDEYSFVFKKSTTLYGRRASKLVSIIVSLFSATYVRFWAMYLPSKPLLSTPCFDGRAVLYPSDRNLRDYLAWRQVDTHVNNQYNTCFWALVQSGKAAAEAQAVLKGTQADFKNELLYKSFGINYNQLPARYRKGSVVLRRPYIDQDGTHQRTRMAPTTLHEDIIADKFWQENADILQ